MVKSQVVYTFYLVHDRSSHLYGPKFREDKTIVSTKVWIVSDLSLDSIHRASYKQWKMSEESPRVKCFPRLSLMAGHTVRLFSRLTLGGYATRPVVDRNR